MSLTATATTPSANQISISLPPLQPKQQKVWDTYAGAKRGTRTIIGYGGAVNSGKSAALCIIAWNIGLFYPGAHIVIARHHQNALKNPGGTMDQFYKFAPCDGKFVKDGGIITKKAVNNEPVCEFRLPDWAPGVVSKVFFRGMTETDFFASAEVTAILVDEADEISEYNITYALLRLRQRFPSATDPLGRKPKYLFYCGSNPAEGWFKDWFIDGIEEKMQSLLEIPDIGTITFIPAVMSDNKFVDKGYSALLKAMLPEEMNTTLGEGSFDSIPGKIFPHFSENIHALYQEDRIVNGMSVPGLRSWPEGSTRTIMLRGQRLQIPHFKYALGGLDFGGVQKRAHLTTGAVSIVMENGRDIMIDCFGDNGPGVHARQKAWMKDMETALKTQIQWVGDNTQPVGLASLRDNGFSVLPNQGKNDSWKTTVAFMRNRQMLDNDGMPKSLYLAHNKDWAREMSGYRIDPVPNADGSFSERPIRVRDDRVDAYRYLNERLMQILRMLAPRRKLPYKQVSGERRSFQPLAEYDSFLLNR